MRDPIIPVPGLTAEQWDAARHRIAVDASVNPGTSGDLTAALLGPRPKPPAPEYGNDFARSVWHVGGTRPVGVAAPKGGLSVPEARPFAEAILALCDWIEANDA